MLRWSELTATEPEIANEARAMLCSWGVGLGQLATIRPDGAPRVHPICPLFRDDDLYAFLVVGPKLHDLRRDPRFALHSDTFPPPNHDDGVSMAGVVEELDDPELRAALTAQLLAERSLTEPWPGFETEALVELRVDRLMVVLTLARNGFPAGNTIWRL